MDSIEKLTEIFKDFPGIGERQARRFVYYLMSRNPDYASNLTSLISNLKRETAQCKECFRYFILPARNASSIADAGGDNKPGKVCDICTSTNADESTLMIVEKDSDLESVRKSRVYSGKYFIFGGTVPIVEKTTKNWVRIEELKQKVKNSPNLKEVILAFSLTPQGEHTDSYVREELKILTEEKSIKISSLGRGLSTGTELEYSDNETLKNALRNRQ